MTQAYGITAKSQNGHGYESVLSQLVGAVMGKGAFYYVTIGSVLAVLSLSANTSFSGFPRLCQLVAEDDFLPHSFANLGRRLVYSSGIAILALFTALLLIFFKGVTDRLIPLFAVGAFLAFSLSQAGMVAHWRREGGRHAKVSLVINAIGAAVTVLALGIILIAKFHEGAWLTALVIPALVVMFNRVRRHYKRVQWETRCRRRLDLSAMAEPIVIIPVSDWNSMAEKALRLALRLSSRIHAVYVSTDADETRELQDEWDKFVREPLEEAQRPDVRLVTISSPYRLLYDPILNYVRRIRREYPDCFVTVLIPELVPTTWAEVLLHNHHATGLKARLLFEKDPQLVVMNVPWHLGEARCRTLVSERVEKKQKAGSVVAGL